MLLAQTNGSHFRSSVAEIFNFLTFSRELLVPLVHCCPEDSVHTRYINAQSKWRQLRSQGKSWVENVCLLAQCPACARNNTGGKKARQNLSRRSPYVSDVISGRLEQSTAAFFSRGPRRKEIYIWVKLPIKRTGKCGINLFIQGGGWVFPNRDGEKTHKKETFHIHKIRAN